MKKKPIKRDKKALEKTLQYLISARGRKPTTVRQAAREMGVSAQAAGARLATLQQQGLAKRVARGVYAPNGPTSQQTMAFGPQPDPNAELLEALLKERETLDAKIERVREVIELHKARTK